MMGFSHGGLDPERKWFDADLVAAAEAMWRRREQITYAGPGRNPDCERRYETCAVRWGERRGFICNPFCRERIPGYRKLSDEEAYRLFGKRGLPSRTKPKVPDLPEPKRHTDEELAHVAACAKLIRLYLDHGERRRQAAVRGKPAPPPLDLIPTDRLTAAEIETAAEALMVAAGLRG